MSGAKENLCLEPSVPIHDNIEQGTLHPLPMFRIEVAEPVHLCSSLLSVNSTLLSGSTRFLEPHLERKPSSLSLSLNLSSSGLMLWLKASNPSVFTYLQSLFAPLAACL